MSPIARRPTCPRRDPGGLPDHGTPLHGTRPQPTSSARDNCERKRLVCESGIPSRLVGTLAARGWVETRINAENRREKFLSLTAQGRTLEFRIRQIEDQLYDWLRALVSEPDQHVVRRILRQIASDGPASRAIEERRGGVRKAE